MDKQVEIKLNQMLKEYEHLRSEISQSKNISTQTLSGFLGLAGLMLGFVFNANNKPQQMSVIFIVISVLGLIGLWFTYTRRQGVLIAANYIRTVLEKDLSGIRWESKLHTLQEEEKKKIPSLLASHGVIYSFITLLGAISTMIIGFFQQSQSDELYIVSVSISIVLIFLLIISLFYQKKSLTATSNIFDDECNSSKDKSVKNHTIE